MKYPIAKKRKSAAPCKAFIRKVNADTMEYCIYWTPDQALRGPSFAITPDGLSDIRRFAQTIRALSHITVGNKIDDLFQAFPGFIGAGEMHYTKRFRKEDILREIGINR